jgi:flagellar hook protein FlgE
MGYLADANGVALPGAAVPLQLPTIGISPSATALVNLEMNLDARQMVTAPATLPAIDFSDTASFNSATSLTVYDGRGQSIPLTYYFQKAADSTWNIFATANGSTVAGTDADPQPVTTVIFAPDGSTVTAPVGDLLLDIPSTTDANGNATLPITGVAVRLQGSTQFAAPFGPTNVMQDGFSAGQMASLTIDDAGMVMARYTNGQTKPVGQIEMAIFRNPQGLRSLGGNLWTPTLAAGDPVLGVPGQGNLGTLKSGALEQSNIDLTGELVAMITAQRSYQANAQTIKTQDQVLQTLVNIR